LKRKDENLSEQIKVAAGEKKLEGIHWATHEVRGKIRESRKKVVDRPELQKRRGIIATGTPGGEMTCMSE